MSHYQTVRNFQRNHLGFPTVISDWRKKERPHPNKTNEWEKETLSKRENNNCSFAIMAYPKKYKCISRAFWCIHYFKWKFLKRRKYGRDGERGRVGAVYIRNKRNFCSARGDGKRGKRVKRNGRKWRVCRIHLLCYDLARFSEGENAFILRDRQQNLVFRLWQIKGNGKIKGDKLGRRGCTEATFGGESEMYALWIVELIL